MINPAELRIVGFIYIITNIVNGKLYIGATKKTIKQRWNEHKHNSINKKKKALINDAIYKYGHENFKIELLKTCYLEDQLYASEQYFIQKYQTNDRRYGYNNSIGGKISSLGKRLSLETKNKLSKYQKLRQRKPHSVETKHKMKLAALGRDMSKAYKASAIAKKGQPAKNRVIARQYSLDGKFIKEYGSITEAAIAVNGCVTAFSSIRRGRLKTYKQFRWTLQNFA